MPELPEVETIRRTLIRKNIIGKKVATIHFSKTRVIRASTQLQKQFVRELIGEQVVRLERRGKFLFIVFEKNSLIIHFGMSGVLYWYNNRKEGNRSGKSNDDIRGTLKHQHLYLSFTDQSRLLVVDPRTFGRIIPYQHRRIVETIKTKKLKSNYPKKIEAIAYWKNHFSMGYDAWLTRLDVLVTVCWKKAQSSGRPIKSFLLDQSIICGIGNIYADETLFNAKIIPTRKVSTLSLEKWRIVIVSMKKILKKAIQRGGTTISDYRRPDGLAGQFQSEFQVYGRGGCSCMLCGHGLEKTTLQNRTTVYCSHCQF